MKKVICLYISTCEIKFVLTYVVHKNNSGIFKKMPSDYIIHLVSNLKIYKTKVIRAGQGGHEVHKTI